MEKQTYKTSVINGETLPKTYLTSTIDAETLPKTYLTSTIDAENLPQTFEDFDKYVEVYIWRDPQDPSGEVRARTVVSIELTTLFESDTLRDLANSCFSEPVDWSCHNCVDRTKEQHILFEYASRDLFERLLNWSIEPDEYELPEADDGTD